MSSKKLWGKHNKSIPSPTPLKQYPPLSSSLASQIAKSWSSSAAMQTASMNTLKQAVQSNYGTAPTNYPPKTLSVSSGTSTNLGYQNTGYFSNYSNQWTGVSPSLEAAVNEIIALHPTRVNEAISPTARDSAAIMFLIDQVTSIAPGFATSEISVELGRQLKGLQDWISWNERGY